eukprot:403333489
MQQLKKIMDQFGVKESQENLQLQAGNSLQNDSFTKQSKSSFFYQNLGQNVQHQQQDKGKYRSEMVVNNYKKIQRQLNNSAQIKVKTKQIMNNASNWYLTKPKSRERNNTLDSKKKSQSKSSKRKCSLQQNTVIGNESLGYTQTMDSQINETDVQQLLQQRLNPSQKYTNNMSHQGSQSKIKQDTSPKQVYSMKKIQLNVNQKSQTSLLKKSLQRANDLQRSIEEKQSSDAQMSPRNLQQYQDLLKPKGLDMFSSQILRSELESKEELHKQNKREKNEQSKTQRQSGGSKEQLMIQAKGIRDLTNSQKVLAQFQTSSINQDIQVVEDPVYFMNYQDTPLFKQDLLEEQKFNFLNADQSQQNQAKNLTSSKITSISHTPPDWDSIYMEQRQRMNSFNVGQRPLENKLISKQSEMQAEEKQVNNRMTGVFSNQSKKQIVYQRDSKNPSSQASKPFINYGLSTEKIKTSMIHKISIDEEECRDVGTSPPALDEELIFINEPQIESKVFKEVIYQNIANQDTSQSQLYIGNQVQDYNTEQQNISKLSKSALGQRPKKLLDYFNTNRRIIVKDVNGGKRVITPNSKNNVDEQQVQFNINGHHIVSMEQRLKGEIYRLYQTQNFNSREMVQNQILNQVSSVNRNQQMSIIEDQGQSRLTNAPIQNMRQSKISHITSTDVDNSKLMNYANIYYGQNKYSDYQESRLDYQHGRTNKLNSEDFTNIKSEHLSQIKQIAQKQHSLMRQIGSPEYDQKSRSKISLNNQQQNPSESTHTKRFGGLQLTHRQQSSKRQSFDLSNFSKGDLAPEMSLYNRIINPIADIYIQNKTPTKMKGVNKSQESTQIRIRKSQQNWLNRPQTNQNAKDYAPDQSKVKKGGLFQEISRQFSEATNNQVKLHNTGNISSKSNYNLSSNKLKNNETANLLKIRDTMKQNLLNNTDFQFDYSQNPEVFMKSAQRLGFKPKTPSDETYSKYLTATTDKKQKVLNQLNKQQMQCLGYPFLINQAQSNTQQQVTPSGQMSTGIFSNFDIIKGSRTPNIGIRRERRLIMGL